MANAQAVKNAAQVRPVTGAGLISARAVKVDAANDLAFLKITNKEGRMKSEETFKPLAIAASRTAKLGGTLALVGFPNIGLQGLVGFSTAKQTNFTKTEAQHFRAGAGTEIGNQKTGTAAEPR